MQSEENDVELNESSDASSESLGDTTAPGEEEGIITGEKKSPISRSTLIVFVVMALGAGGVYLMYRQAGPRSASAAVVKQSADAGRTIQSFLSAGGTSMKSMHKLLQDTQKVVQQFLAYPSMTQVPLNELRTNPFRQRVQVATADPNASEAAEKKKREEERQAILKTVQTFQLQSIMCSGKRNACMINNTLYSEGQTIDGFTIDKITSTGVVVKNGPYGFELRMQR